MGGTPSRLTPAQRRYEAGYTDGRTACLTAGDAASARAVLEAKQADHEVDSAYVAGFEWAIWDYNDANGLKNERPARPA